MQAPGEDVPPKRSRPREGRWGVGTRHKLGFGNVEAVLRVEGALLGLFFEGEPQGLVHCALAGLAEKAKAGMLVERLQSSDVFRGDGGELVVGPTVAEGLGQA